MNNNLTVIAHLDKAFKHSHSKDKISMKSFGHKSPKTLPWNDYAQAKFRWKSEDINAWHLMFGF